MSSGETLRPSCDIDALQAAETHMNPSRASQTAKKLFEVITLADPSYAPSTLDPSLASWEEARQASLVAKDLHVAALAQLDPDQRAKNLHRLATILNDGLRHASV